MLGMLTPSWWGQGGYGFLALSHVKAGARLLQGSPLHRVQALMIPLLLLLRSILLISKTK